MTLVCEHEEYPELTLMRLLGDCDAGISRCCKMSAILSIGAIRKTIPRSCAVCDWLRISKCWNNGVTVRGAFVHGCSNAHKEQSRAVHTLHGVVIYYDRGLRPPATCMPKLSSSFLTMRVGMFQHQKQLAFISM